MRYTFTPRDANGNAVSKDTMIADFRKVREAYKEAVKTVLEARAALEKAEALQNALVDEGIETQAALSMAFKWYPSEFEAFKVSYRISKDDKKTAEKGMAV